MSQDPIEGTCSYDRRTVLAGACVVAVSRVLAPSAADAQAGRLAKGDVLVVDDGPDKGKQVTLEMVKAGALLAAWPADAASGTPKTASRFNKLVLVRLPPAEIGESFKPHAAEGVIAFSAICTHQNCTVSGWRDGERIISCFCHGSEFSATEGGKVVKGPATKRLPILPLSVGDNGLLLVAGEFTGKPGPGPA